MLKHFAVLAVAVLGFSGLVSAAEAPVLKAGTITGTVLSAEGKVVAGATVEFKNSANEVVKTTTTDKLGAYRLEGVKAGTYTAVIANKNMGTIKVSEEGKSTRFIAFLSGDQAAEGSSAGVWC